MKKTRDLSLVCLANWSPCLHIFDYFSLASTLFFFSLLPLLLLLFAYFALIAISIVVVVAVVELVTAACFNFSICFFLVSCRPLCRVLRRTLNQLQRLVKILRIRPVYATIAGAPH